MADSMVGAEKLLQAILLADSFDQKFGPITLERPKALFPLVNRPTIDYTLSWLESAGVDEVFVFVSAHSDQIITYLDKSDWLVKPNFRVTTIVSHNSVSCAGDALRLIYKHNVIHGDFVLIGGVMLSNMSLTEALQVHTDTRKKDNSAVMTMVIQESLPHITICQTSIGIDEIFMAIDPDTEQLLYYDPSPKQIGDFFECIDNNLLPDKPSALFHNHKQDCYIYICSPEVLTLFAGNLDYQHLRHFVEGLLLDDMVGYKIFTHEIKYTYADRVDNFLSYETISKSIMFKAVGVGIFASERKVSGMREADSAQIDCRTVIGKDTSIGNNTKVRNSVIGEGCVIGFDVSIEDCYIWNNVTVEGGCKLKHAVICDGVILKSGVVLNPGVVLSFNVVIGQQFVVPAYSRVSLLQQPIKQDSEEELEYADQVSGSFDSSFTPTAEELSRDFASLLPNSPSYAASEVGAGGAGYIWPVCDGSLEEEWRLSVAPIPYVELIKLMQINDVDRYVHEDDNIFIADSVEDISMYDSEDEYDEDSKYRNLCISDSMYEENERF